MKDVIFIYALAVLCATPAITIVVLFVCTVVGVIIEDIKAKKEKRHER